MSAPDAGMTDEEYADLTHRHRTVGLDDDDLVLLANERSVRGETWIVTDEVIASWDLPPEDVRIAYLMWFCGTSLEGWNRRDPVVAKALEVDPYQRARAKRIFEGWRPSRSPVIPGAVGADFDAAMDVRRVSP